jgi:molybdopterin synthase sulfur carrier subunit
MTQRDMAVRVVLPMALLRLFPGCAPEVTVEARTVAEMVDALDAKWPGMRDRLCDSRPAVRRHINIFVDGGRTDLAGRVSAGATVFIMTAISGG